MNVCVHAAAQRSPALRLHKMMLGVAFVHSAINYDVSVCHLRNGCHLVRHKQHGGVLLQLADYFIKLWLELFVDIRQRFVEHQHFALPHDCPRQQGTLQLSARHFANAAVLQVAESHQLKRVCQGFIVGCGV